MNLSIEMPGNLENSVTVCENILSSRGKKNRFKPKYMTKVAYSTL